MLIIKRQNVLLCRWNGDERLGKEVSDLFVSIRGKLWVMVWILVY